MDSKLITFLGIIGLATIAFYFLRSIAIWYWKIDEHLDNQRKIIALLEDIKINQQPN